MPQPATVAAKRELGIEVAKRPLARLAIAVQGRVRCCGCKAVGPFLINRELLITGLSLIYLGMWMFMMSGSETSVIKVPAGKLAGTSVFEAEDKISACPGPLAQVGPHPLGHQSHKQQSRTGHVLCLKSVSSGSQPLCPSRGLRVTSGLRLCLLSVREVAAVCCVNGGTC